MVCYYFGAPAFILQKGPGIMTRWYPRLRTSSNQGNLARSCLVLLCLAPLAACAGDAPGDFTEKRVGEVRSSSSIVSTTGIEER